MSKQKMMAGCLVFLLGGAMSQTYAQATIKGTISDTKVKNLYLGIPVADSFRNDTIRVKDGNFSWKGQVAEPTYARLFSDHGVHDFFIENKPMQLTMGEESYHLAGSPVNDEYEKYRTSREGIDKVYYEVSDRVYGAKDSSDAVKAALRKEQEQAEHTSRKFITDYISAHRSSYVSLMLIDDIAAIDAPYQYIDSLFQLLDNQVRHSQAAERLTKQVAVLKKRSEGQPFFEFSQKDINGNMVHFSDLKGKYILVDFWASWCGPCRAENPNVLKAYQQYKDKNFTVIGISLDDDGNKWKKAVTEDGMPWLQLSDLKGSSNEVARYYNINAIPFSFLLDPQGRIIARGLRGTELQQQLSSLLH
jgi:thiol-disulfide isomerase/thioredoxin